MLKRTGSWTGKENEVFREINEKYGPLPQPSGLSGRKRARSSGNGSGSCANMTRLDIEHELRNVRVDKYATWSTMIDHDIPFPMSFLLFRMHIHVKSGCMLFMKSGEETGSLVIKEASISFQRNTSAFSVYVSSRFDAGACIAKPQNIFRQQAMACTGYRGGAGTSLWNPQRDADKFHNGDLTKDVFVMAVPYNYKPKDNWTDITGQMDAAYYASPGYRLSKPMFPTAEAYRQVWQFEHADVNPLMIDDSPLDWKATTLAVQATQRVYSSRAGEGEGHSKLIRGHDAFGASGEPLAYSLLHDFNVNQFDARP
jgi:hypothetical protein